MTMRKRLLCLMLAASMLIVGLTGCKDSSNETNTVQVDYNAEEEVAKYKDYLGEIPEADKDYVVELIAIGNPLKLSPDFPPLRTVHAAFTAHGAPSEMNFNGFKHNLHTSSQH